MAADDSTPSLFGDTGPVMRRCRRCEESKPRDEFRVRVRQGYRYREGICKACRAEQNAAWDRKNKKRAARARVAWKQRNAERVKRNDRAWKEKNPERAERTQRKHKLRKHYNMSLSEYEALHGKQAGRCALCGRPERRVYRNGLSALLVDHDHRTGVVRALLCRPCNTILGMAGDDATLLRAAADYIDKHKKEADSGTVPGV